MCHRISRPEFGSVPAFVGPAADASNDHHAEPIGPGEHTSPFARPDADRAIAFEREALARFKLEHAAALERDVHLFLTVRRVVVPRMASGIGREIYRLYAEAGQSKFGADLSHRAAEGGLHLIDALTRRVWHRVLPSSCCLLRAVCLCRGDPGLWMLLRSRRAPPASASGEVRQRPVARGADLDQLRIGERGLKLGEGLPRAEHAARLHPAPQTARARP